MMNVGLHDQLGQLIVTAENLQVNINRQPPLTSTVLPPSADPEACLRSWVVRKHLRAHQIHDLLSLLDQKYLRSLRVRKKSKAWPKNPQANNFRHHFYRQAAHILGWVDQQVFEQEFIDIVKSTWPDTSNASTSIMEEVKGGEYLLCFMYLNFIVESYE